MKQCVKLLEYQRNLPLNYATKAWNTRTLHSTLLLRTSTAEKLRQKLRTAKHTSPFPPSIPHSAPTTQFKRKLFIRGAFSSFPTTVRQHTRELDGDGEVQPVFLGADVQLLGKFFLTRVFAPLFRPNPSRIAHIRELAGKASESAYNIRMERISYKLFHFVHPFFGTLLAQTRGWVCFGVFSSE